MRSHGGRVIKCASCGSLLALHSAERARKVIRAHRKVCPSFKTLFPVRKTSAHALASWR